MRILMVLTSHDRLGENGAKTGSGLEEFCAAYYVFKDAGADVALASPIGGQPPVDSAGEGLGHQPTVLRFKGDQAARTELADTLALDQVAPEDFDAVFYVGGHGAMCDLPEDRFSQAVIAALHATGRPIALVSHGVAALRHVQGADGRPLVEGRHVTGPANSEEEAQGLTEVLPFLLQDELVRLGGLYGKAPNWTSHVVRDGTLITGQNRYSAADTANAVLELARAMKSRN